MAEANSRRKILQERRQEDACSPWTNGDTLCLTVLQGALAGWCVAPQPPEVSPKTTECPREEASISLAGVTTLVTTQAGWPRR